MADPNTQTVPAGLALLSSPPKSEAELNRLVAWTNAVRTLADTIRLLSDQGAAIDAQAVAAGLGLPLRETTSLGPLFQYHVTSGCFTINEVRASTGRPPVPWGEERATASLSTQPAAPAPGGTPA